MSILVIAPGAQGLNVEQDLRSAGAGVAMVVVPPVTGEWAVGVSYLIGDEVTYGGATYRCRQAHVSQAGWTPPAVPALWLLVTVAAVQARTRGRKKRS